MSKPGVSTAMDDDGFPADGAAAVDERRTIVVRRGSRRLRSQYSLPCLFACLGLAVLGYRLASSDWVGIVRYADSSRAVANASPTTEDPATAQPPPPSPKVRVTVEPTHMDDVANDPPFAWPIAGIPARGVDFEFGFYTAPLPLAAAANREENPLEEIQRESELASMERAELERLKLDEEEFQARDAELRRTQRAIEIPKADRDRRMAFRSELSQILKRAGAQPRPASEVSAEIVQLCTKYGVNPELELRMPRAIWRVPTTQSARTGFVAEMRSKGLTEPGLLCELARVEASHMVTRNGPKSVDEVMIRAARNLLATPVATTRMGTEKPRRAPAGNG